MTLRALRVNIHDHSTHGLATTTSKIALFADAYEPALQIAAKVFTLVFSILDNLRFRRLRASNPRIAEPPLR